MFMQSSYAETFLKREDRKQDKITKCLLIAAIIISALGVINFLGMQSLLLAFVSLVVAIILIGVSCYMFPRFSVDWEYVFVDGQLDFDQILGGNARKQKDRIDFEKVEVVAKTGSYHLDNFKRADMRVLDYSSLRVDAKTYSIIVHKGNELCTILFEPDENMLKMMKQKSPRKVFED